MADTPLLQRDRYDSALLLLQLSGQSTGKDHDSSCFWFDLDGERVPAYLPDDAARHEAARARLAEFLAQIRELDNAVQASLEAEHRSVGGALRDYKLYIGWMRLDDDDDDDDDRRITVRYWGEIVNTEHEVVFERSADGRWEPGRKGDCENGLDYATPAPRAAIRPGFPPWAGFACAVGSLVVMQLIWMTGAFRNTRTGTTSR